MHRKKLPAHVAHAVRRYAGEPKERLEERGCAILVLARGLFHRTGRLGSMGRKCIPAEWNTKSSAHAFGHSIIVEEQERVPRIE
jgi:hypothetical protein